MDAFLNSLSRFLHRLLDVAEGPWASTQVLLAALSAGLGVLTITLIVMMYSRWGQMHALRKCLILSLLAHLLLAISAATIRIQQYTPPRPEVIEVAISDAGLQPKPLSPDAGQRKGMASAEPVKPWEPSPQQVPGRPIDNPMARPELPDTLPPQKTVVSEAAGLPGVGSASQLPLAEAAAPQPEALQALTSIPQPAAAKAAEPIEAAKASRREGVQTKVPGQQQFRPGLPAGNSEPAVAKGSHVGSPNSLLDGSLPLPTIKDVRPTLGPGPGDSLPGAIDSQPSHGPSQVAATYLPEASPGVRGPTVPGESGSGEAGLAAGANDGTSPVSPGGHAGVTPDVPSGPVGGPEMASTAPFGPPTIGSEGGTGSGAGSPWASGGPGIAPALPSRRQGFSDRDIPGIYKGRVAPDRSRLAQRQGATEQSEKAVLAALAFLAKSQEADGHFDASLHEAGREMRIAGRDRQSAGGKSDTGMTGLALLAFLASGHTHQQGDYSANVRRGLEYLMRKQRADGGLGGDGIVYEYMYCHAMAAFALGEAYGMSGDERLEPYVRKAVGFTLAMQKPPDRRLAVHHGRPRRHQPARLAAHGPEERRAGRHSHSQRVAAGCAPLSQERFLREPGRPGRLSDRRDAYPDHDRRSPRLPPVSRHATRHSRRQGSGRIPPRRGAGRGQGKHLLLVLRHPGDAPTPGRLLGTLERLAPESPGRLPEHQRPERR
jgi:hypothetical protein